MQMGLDGRSVKLVLIDGGWKWRWVKVEGTILAHAHHNHTSSHHHRTPSSHVAHHFARYIPYIIAIVPDPIDLSGCNQLLYHWANAPTTTFWTHECHQMTDPSGNPGPIKATDDGTTKKCAGAGYSIPVPPACEAGALPFELHPQGCQAQPTWREMFCCSEEKAKKKNAPTGIRTRR